MEDYLLDTNIASLVVDGGNRLHQESRTFLASLAPSHLFISAVTLAEISYGLETSPAVDASRHTLMRQALAGFSILPIDHHTAEDYARIRAALFLQHSPRDTKGRLTKKHPEDLLEHTTGKALGIDENDLWIVSIAVQYSLHFVTRDLAGGMQRVIAAANYQTHTTFWQPIPNKG